MACPSDTSTDSVKTCAQGFSRALQRPPSSVAYLQRRDEAKKYEHAYWQSFLEKSKEKRVCIRCSTVNIKLGCPVSYFGLNDTWTQLLEDVLSIRQVSVITTGDVSFWRLSLKFRGTLWLKEVNTKIAVDSIFSLLQI